MDLLIVFDIDKQLRNSYPELGMYNLRGDFAERDKNELSIRHLGMRNAQGFFLHDNSVI